MRFGPAWLLAGVMGTILSGVVLGTASALAGQPVWMPLNATSHGLHGAAAAEFTGMDFRHTGLGLVIHVASSFFWAAVAVVLLRWMGGRLVWLAGLGTALVAGAVDYGLMPARLTPGWELVLPPAGVIAGLLALGVGLSLGLRSGMRLASPGR